MLSLAPVINPPSPLYGIDTVKPSGSVVVVEGRENRDVLAENTGWNVVSHDRDVNVFNWSALAGRDVIVWPTYSKDRAAAVLGLDVCGKLHGVAADVRRVDLTRWSNDGKVPSTLRDGWGSIDALASPGISRDLAAFISHMAPKTLASTRAPVERVNAPSEPVEASGEFPGSVSDRVVSSPAAADAEPAERNPENPAAGSDPVPCPVDAVDAPGLSECLAHDVDISEMPAYLDDARPRTDAEWEEAAREAMEEGEARLARDPSAALAQARADTLADMRAGLWVETAVYSLLGDKDELERKAKCPKIEYQESQLGAVIQSAAAAAMEGGAPIYKRGSMLVQPVAERNINASDKEPHKFREVTAKLKPWGKLSLRERLTHHAQWEKYDGRSGSNKPIACPPVVAETMLDRDGDGLPFHDIAGIVTAPTMRPDGSILSAPGYDAETGLLFVSYTNWPGVPERPTMEDAIAGLDKLFSLAREFPFVSTVDRSAGLALILTAIVRPCLPSSPIFGINAPTPGTGKGKFVDTVCILATGRHAVATTYPANEEEIQKQIGSSLMAGDQFISLDNVTRPVAGNFMCSVLTQPKMSMRVLGASKNVDLPTNVTFCANGNNLKFDGDMTRRAVQINLNANCERPEERTFAFDVIAVAKARRPELVIAALTVLRAFVVQGGPKIRPALGSFEAWSDLVRSAIVWCGWADPLGNSKEIEANDSERDKLQTLLTTMHKWQGSKEWTVSDIGKALESDLQKPDKDKQSVGLAEAVISFMDRQGRLESGKLGKYLKRVDGRILGDLCFKAGKKDNFNRVRWYIESFAKPDAEPERIEDVF
ncbi:hypothetical protein [Rhizobium ruizarguesonis]|uniref:hypothetical protein n=1 Tax=Rhizobium ruizarguesonis TaxID=2081791 RepID=UPI0010325DD5|nr:hypothetical protein [Rhizobium ruizarguesonis]TAY73530.1 hypothetical protein ELH84_06390 [Rhizobium ruizarguesonis]